MHLQPSLAAGRQHLWGRAAVHGLYSQVVADSYCSSGSKLPVTCHTSSADVFWVLLLGRVLVDSVYGNAEDTCLRWLAALLLSQHLVFCFSCWVHCALVGSLCDHTEHLACFEEVSEIHWECVTVQRSQTACEFP